MNGAEFAAWRQRLGLTQEELAKRWAHVTRTTIQNWEGSDEIPHAIETACVIWERRFKQENASLGPLTLVYADGPMFVDPYRPARRPAMMQQEACPTNAWAIARVMALWGKPDFCNPFILEKSGADLWNMPELARVVRGEDTGAPTIHNLLNRAVAYIGDTSSMLARSGPKALSSSEMKLRKKGIELIVAEFEQLAETKSWNEARYRQYEAALERLQDLGSRLPQTLVEAVAHAFEAGRR